MSEADGDWCVLVVEDLGQQLESEVHGAADEQDAVRKARWLAREFQPAHPMLPRGREVFRVGEHRWLVRVDGRSRTGHFEVVVARRESETHD